MIDREKSKEYITTRLENYKKLKENYMNSISLVFFSCIILFFSSAFLFYSFFHYETPHSYLALDENNKLLNEPPLTKFHLSQPEIIMWANNVLIDLYSYDYLSLNSHGNSIKDYFYEKNVDKYMKEFYDLNLQRVVSADKAVVKPEILNVFEIEQKGVYTTDGVDRAYVKLKGDMMLLVYGLEGTKGIRYEVSMFITRDYRSKAKDGLSIAVINLVKK